MSAKFEPVDAEAKAAEIRTFIHNHGDSAPHPERLSVFLALNELRAAATDHSDASSIGVKLNEERAQLTIERSRVEAENGKLQRELAKLSKDKEEFLAKLLVIDFAKLTELLARGCQTPAHSVDDGEANRTHALAGNGLNGNPNGLIVGFQVNRDTESNGLMLKKSSQIYRKLQRTPSVKTRSRTSVKQTVTHQGHLWDRKRMMVMSRIYRPCKPEKRRCAPRWTL
jgi:hypothetical protein